MAVFGIYRNMTRTYDQILTDVASTNMITRDDVFELLNQYSTKASAISGLRSFLSTVPDKAIAFNGDRQLGIERIISDIDSYKVWNENILN